MSFVLCEDTDENGETCGRNSTLEVLKEVKKVYEERLKRIDEEACGNGTQLKLRTLQSWIIDLENQNTSLIHVVEQLEQEAKACLCKTPCPVTGVNVPLQSSMPMQNDFQRLNSTMSSLLRDKDDMQRSLESANDSIRELKCRDQDSKLKLENLINNLSSKEKVAANMEEMIKILQDSLNLAQKEQEELKNKLNEKEAKLDEAQMKIRDLLDEIGDLRAENNQLLGNVRDQDECERRCLCTPRLYNRMYGEEHTDPNEDGKNDIYISRVSSEGELQLIQLMDEQKDEILYCEKKISQLKASYDAVFCKNKTLEREMELLKQELGNYNNHINDSECHTCVSQNEADNCLTTFESLQEKIYVLKGLLKEKTNNYEQLQNELSNTKLAFDELEERSNEELNCLRGELECFKEKLHNYEHENEYLIEEDKKNKQLILDAANREVKLQKECTIREKQLVDKLKSIQNENFNFTHTIDKLAEQLADFRCELAEKNTEVQGLVKQNQSLHETIEHLQNEIEDHKRMKTKVKRAFSIFIKENTDLANEVEELRRLLYEYSKKAEKCTSVSQNEVNSCKGLLSSIQDKVSLLKNVIQMNVDELNSYHTGNEVLQETLAEIKEQCDSIRVAGTEKTEIWKVKAVELEGRCKSLYEEVVSLNCIIDDYKKKIDSSEQNNFAIQTKMDSISCQLNTTQHRVTVLEQLLKDKNDEYEEEKLKRDDMENKYNSLEKSMVSVQKLFEDYVHYIDSSEQRTSTAQKEIYCCKQTLNGIQRKVLMLQHLLKSTCEDFIRFQGIKNSNNELENRSELIESLQNNLEEVNMHFTAALEKLDERETRVKSLKAHVCKLKEKIQTCGNQQVEIENLQNEVIRLKAELRHLTKLQNKLNSENSCMQEEVKKFQEAQEEHGKENETFLQKQKELKEQYDKLQKENDLLKDELQKLKDMLLEAEKEKCCLHIKVTDLENQINILQEKNNNLQERFEKSRESQALSDKEEAKLHKIQVKLKCQQNALEMENSFLKDDLTNLKNAMSKSEKSRSRLFSKLTEVQNQLNMLEKENAFLQGELQELREVQTATDKEFNLETRVSELLEQLNALERERIFMQGEFNRLKETETASDREKTKLQNRMVKLQNQKNNIEIQLDCIESSVKELANICTETSRKNINTPSPTTTTCHGEACYMSTKIIKTAYNYIKELCKDIQNLKSSLQERDEIITNIQQKDKKQAVLLKNARKKIGILWRALKASEMRDSQCGIECPAVREDVILDHACEEDWDATHCGITFSNVPEVQVCYMNNCRTDDSFHSSSC